MSQGQWKIWLDQQEVVNTPGAVKKLGTFLQLIPSSRLADCLLTTMFPKVSAKGLQQTTPGFNPSV